MSELTEIINNHLSERVQKGELENDNIVSIIDNIGSYLNLQTISDYSKSQKISYNAVLKRIQAGKVKEYSLFNVKFIIDNE